TLLAILVCAVPEPATPAATDRPCVLVVVGASGAPEYADQFQQWAAQWQAAAAKAGADSIAIGVTNKGGDPDRERLRAALAEKAAAPGKEPLWIILIGHGTFDGREAKFNLRGPDVSDLELAQWLAPIKRPLALMDCTAASGPFLSRLSGAD